MQSVVQTLDNEVSERTEKRNESFSEKTMRSERENDV